MSCDLIMMDGGDVFLVIVVVIGVVVVAFVGEGEWGWGKWWRWRWRRCCCWYCVVYVWCSLKVCGNANFFVMSVAAHVAAPCSRDRALDFLRRSHPPRPVFFWRLQYL